MAKCISDVWDFLDITIFMRKIVALIAKIIRRESEALCAEYRKNIIMSETHQISGFA